MNSLSVVPSSSHLSVYIFMQFASRQDDLLDFMCTEPDALIENVSKAESILDSLRDRMEGESLIYKI